MKSPFNNIKINNSNQLLLDKRYNLLNELGSGHSSIVFKVLDTFTKEIKVAKIFGSHAESEFEKEKKIIEKISENNIDSSIKFFESGSSLLNINGRTKQTNYIILEYCDKGTLYDKIENTSEGFSEDVCKYILFEIIKAEKSLNEIGICHRDIKLENILLVGDNYKIKLSDFGLSKNFLDKNLKRKKLKKLVGTPYYCAPEILEHKYYDGEKVDYFSIGALLFILMTKKFAFEEAKTFKYIEKESQKLYNLIKTNQLDEYWNIIENFYGIKILSPQFKKLFIKMVSYNPSDRPSFEDIMNSEWMEEIKNANEDYLNQLRENMKDQME